MLVDACTGASRLRSARRRRACGCRPGGPRGSTPRRRACRPGAARAGASPPPKSRTAAGRASAGTRADGAGAPGRRRSARRSSVPSRRSSTSIPEACSELGREGRPARLAVAPERDQGLLARLGLGSRRPASRRRRGWRRCRRRRGRTPSTEAPCVASRQAMPSPITPAPMMATSGFAALRVGAVRQPAAPFAGMTQTGSMGLISAASAAAPQAVCAYDGHSFAHARHSRACARRRLIRVPGPVAQQPCSTPARRPSPRSSPAISVGSGPPWAKPMP